MTGRRQFWRLCILSGALLLLAACQTLSPVTQDLSPGVVIHQPDMQTLHKALVDHITTDPKVTIGHAGLVAARGGARLKLLKPGMQQVLLPLPQLTDGQVPLCYYICSTPPEAVVELQLQKREQLNDIVSVHLKGERKQEVLLEWSSVILIAENIAAPTQSRPDSYRAATGCVQSASPEVQQLAGQLWPANGDVERYARNIQQFVKEMEYAKQPRSLDALSILDSGANGICTANANLALAVMRAKGIAARSMAVIPPISRRLEMHRIVEYHHEGRWHFFDPSSLHKDVPMEPWQTVIMAKTTAADEELAMKPRMGSMPGCPYAQEIELISPGVTLWGQDFFWTIADPIAELQVNDEVVQWATQDWKRYLREGSLSQGQIKAASAKTAAEIWEASKID